MNSALRGSRRTLISFICLIVRSHSNWQSFARPIERAAKQWVIILIDAYLDKEQMCAPCWMSEIFFRTAPSAASTLIFRDASCFSRSCSSYWMTIYWNYLWFSCTCRGWLQIMWSLSVHCCCNWALVFWHTWDSVDAKTFPEFQGNLEPQWHLPVALGMSLDRFEYLQCVNMVR